MLRLDIYTIAAQLSLTESSKISSQNIQYFWSYSHSCGEWSWRCLEMVQTIITRFRIPITNLFRCWESDRTIQYFWFAYLWNRTRSRISRSNAALLDRNGAPIIKCYPNCDFRLVALFRSNTNRIQSFSTLSLQSGNALIWNFQGFIASTLVDSTPNLRSKYQIMNERGVKT